jgi:hypothetical protein
MFVIEKQHLQFFPEYVQKEILKKLAKAFEPDRPYSYINVEKIKNKFREWDMFKVQTANQHLKYAYNEKSLRGSVLR